MESLFVDLIGLLERNLPWLRTIDEDYGQLENIDDENADMYPLIFPAVLIETPETQWSDIDNCAQLGECTLRVRLLIDCYDDTHAGSPTVDKIMEREEKRRSLHRLLQGHRVGEEGALIRKESKFFTFNHGIKIYEATYTCAVREAIQEKAKVRKQQISVVVKT
jgi:hypothetical protein